MSKKSKQKKQRNGTNQQSYEKGYSFLKPSTWFASGSAENASTSSVRGILSPATNSPSSSRKVNMNNQPPNPSPSKNINSESSSSSSSAPGRWNFGFGRLWRKGGGGVSDPNAKNRGPQEDIVLTDVPKRHRKYDEDIRNGRDPSNANSNIDSNNMDTGNQQRDSRVGGFFSLFRSSKDKDKDKDKKQSSSPIPPRPDTQRPLQQPYAQNKSANSARPRVVNNRQGPGLGPHNGVVDGRAGRPDPGRAGQSRDPESSSSSRGTTPLALSSTKHGDKNMPPQKKTVTSPLDQNPVTSSARDGRNAERGKGPALSGGDKTNGRKIPPNSATTNPEMNDPNAAPNMRGRNINAAPVGTRQALGAANGNHTRDGARNAGLQGTGMAQRGQSPARNIATGYRPPGDIRKPGEITSSEREVKKMDATGTGLNRVVCAPPPRPPWGFGDWGNIHPILT